MGLTKKEQAALEELVWELSAPHTLEEIAERLGCSIENVWKIEKRALGKLRAMTSEDWRESNS